MEMVKFSLEYNQVLYINLAVCVKNVKDVVKSVIQGDLKCALISPKLIIDVFQIAVAANRAVILLNTDKLITRNIYTEVIFNLSPSKNIRTALNDFGVKETDDYFLVCVIGTDGIEIEKFAEDVRNKIDATFKFPSWCELVKFVDVNEVIKHYKIPSEESDVSDLLKSVVTRIAAKGF